MRLKEYIEQFPVPKRKAIKLKIASAAAVSLASVNHWCNGTKRPSPLHAQAVVKVTRHEVELSDLRPDIYPPQAFAKAANG